MKHGLAFISVLALAITLSACGKQSPIEERAPRETPSAPARDDRPIPTPEFFGVYIVTIENELVELTLQNGYACRWTTPAPQRNPGDISGLFEDNDLMRMFSAMDGAPTEYLDIIPAIRLRPDEIKGYLVYGDYPIARFVMTRFAVATLPHDARILDDKGPGIRNPGVYINTKQGWTLDGGFRHVSEKDRLYWIVPRGEIYDPPSGAAFVAIQFGDGRLWPFVIESSSKARASQAHLDSTDATTETEAYRSRFSLMPEGFISDADFDIEWLIGPDEAMAFDEAEAWLAECGMAGGGWRMPSPEMLASLYRAGSGAHNIPPPLELTGWFVWGDPGFLMPDTPVRDLQTHAWGFHFGLGGPGRIPRSDLGSNRVLGWRDPLLRISTDGVIFDPRTNLEWVLGPDQDTNYAQAEQWVRDCEIAGGGWGMPIRRELIGLYQRSFGKEMGDPAFTTGGWRVWAGPHDSSSAWFSPFSSSAWFFFFDSDQRNWLSRDSSESLRVLGVRSLLGQPLEVMDSGVIFDPENNLEWIIGPDRDAMNYTLAEQWVRDCNVAGGRWRMPTNKELRGLHQRRLGERNMDPSFRTADWMIWSHGGERWGFELSHSKVFAVRSRSLAVNESASTVALDDDILDQLAALGYPSDSVDGAPRSKSSDNLKHLGLVLAMYAGESLGELYPAASSRPGCLMFPAVEADRPAPNQALVFPEYLTDAHVLINPDSNDADTWVKRAAEDPLAVIGDHHFIYLGFAIKNQAMADAFFDAYELTVRESGYAPGAKDIQLKDTGEIGSTLHRLREGIARFFITDINNPDAHAHEESQFIVLIERPTVPTAAVNVLYLDGNVRKVPFGSFPNASEFWDGVARLNSLASIEPLHPDPPVQPQRRDAPPQPGVTLERQLPSELGSWGRLVQRKVEQNWTLTDGMSVGAAGHQVIISFYLTREGGLLDAPVVIDDGGMPPLAASVVQAIKAGQPYPPLPDSTTQLQQQVVCRFTLD